MEISAKELRLGNLVNVPNENQSPFRIDFFEYLSKSDCKIAQRQFIGNLEVRPLTWYLKDLSPIPLSEDILLKLGFEIDLGIDDITYYKKDDLVLDDSFQLVWYENTAIKYLHQLQNLYFALTNEELTMKE